MGKKIKDFLKRIKPEHLMIAACCLIVLSLFFSSFGQFSEKTSDSDVNEYVTMLENKLSSRLSELDGAGKVKVIISVKSGLKNEYATEKEVSAGISGDKTTETPVLISGKPLVVGEVYPEICGVIVMAKGASNVKVKLSIVTAVQTFLAVTSDKIQVLPMK